MRSSNIQKALDAHVNFIRTDFDSNIPDSYLDQTVKSCNDSGLNLLAILDRYTNGRLAWDDSVAYGRYLDTMFSRYGDSVTNWEAINEVDLVDSPHTPQSYASILRTIYTRCKAFNPHSRTILSGFASVFSDAFAHLFTSGAIRFCDVLNMHSYSFPEELLPQFRQVERLCAQANVRKPLWLSETGFHTAPDDNTNAYFYSQILPQALSRLGLQDAVVGYLYDSHRRFYSINDDEIKDFFPDGPLARALSLEDFVGLDPDDVPVVLLSAGEAFPMDCFHHVVDYVRKGGVVACAQGLPFYYDQHADGTRVPVATAYYPSLHIAPLLWWSAEAQQLVAPEVPTWSRSAEGFSVKSDWSFSKGASARYLSDSQMAPGDELIPIVLAGNDSYSGPVAAIYNFNSDLKGALIISTRLDAHPYVNPEREQARRLTRSHLIAFASGVEKVFWYNLRAFEHDSNNGEDHFGILHADFSPKPAYVAYQALTRFLPSGSSRPSLTVKDDVYVATWRTPDGVACSAVWTPYSPKELSDVQIADFATCYDIYGMPTGSQRSAILTISPQVTFVVGQTIRLD